MNTQFRPPNLPLTSQAAEGLLRRRWSVAEIEAIVEAGILLEDERFELIGGEIVPMSPKGNQHEILKASLNRLWAKRLKDDYAFVTETTFRITPDTFLEPDFVFYRTADTVVNLKPETALLVVEIANSSLGYDLGRKASLYAQSGIAELWVINAVTFETHIHTNPGPSQYAEVRSVAGDEVLHANFAPELDVRLTELKLA
jgi:Uma2 family endonuclease